MTGAGRSARRYRVRGKCRSGPGRRTWWERDYRAGRSPPGAPHCARSVRFDGVNCPSEVCHPYPRSGTGRAERPFERSATAWDASLDDVGAPPGNDSTVRTGSTVAIAVSDPAHAGRAFHARVWGRQSDVCRMALWDAWGDGWRPVCGPVGAGPTRADLSLDDISQTDTELRGDWSRVVPASTANPVPCARFAHCR